mgnify:CR=1 FL=1
MSAYEALASRYDALTADVQYEKRADFLEKLFRRSRIPVKVVLDLACGTGACAAVVAAVANGLCEKGRDITVRVQGGDLVVHYTDEAVTLTGDAKLVYTGVVED